MRKFHGRIFLAVLMVCCMMAAVCGGEEIADRTDLAAEDYYGTWQLLNMRTNGYMIPAATLGLTATVVISEGIIEITDVYGETTQYETTFEDGHLIYMTEEDRMKVCISEDGLLHLAMDVLEVEGSVEDENAKKTNSGGAKVTLNMKTMQVQLVDEFFERAEE